MRPHSTPKSGASCAGCEFRHRAARSQEWRLPPGAKPGACPAFEWNSRLPLGMGLSDWQKGSPRIVVVDPFCSRCHGTPPVSAAAGQSVTVSGAFGRYWPGLGSRTSGSRWGTMEARCVRRTGDPQHDSSGCQHYCMGPRNRNGVTLFLFLVALVSGCWLACQVHKPTPLTLRGAHTS